jgi:hypothetical protein
MQTKHLALERRQRGDKGMLRQALELLGLSTPFIYTAATYAAFKYLDKRASAQAKRAISDWLQPLPYDKAAVASAMLEVFDKLFTRPLWGWRAMVRSTIFSLVMMLIYFYEKLLLPAYGGLATDAWEHFGGPNRRHMIFAVAEVVSPIVTNIILDYISLFVVRRWLSVAGEKPMFALLSAWVVGALVIFLLYWVRDFVMIGGTIYFDGFGPHSFRDVLILLMGSFSSSLGLWAGYLTSNDYDVNILFVPAVAIHLWLPLFALCVLFLQVANALVTAIVKMQWFLKKGRDHPLEAVGFLAGAVVFGTAVAARLIW